MVSKAKKIEPANRRKAQEALNIAPEILDEIIGSARTQQDVFGKDGLLKNLQKAILERMLNKELDVHLDEADDDCRNGRSIKQVKSELGEFELSTPRDRNASFEPVIVPKRQRRIDNISDAILSLYTRGMTTRDIQETVKELYGVDVSHTLISEIAGAVSDEVEQWQKRSLEPVYPVIWLDAVRVRVHEDGHVVMKSVHVALGLNMEGKKELVGLWMGENEGAKFWAQMLTDIKSRGVKDVFVFCVDGLKGFPDAIRGVFPDSDVQLCIVHMIRSSTNTVSYKDLKAVCADLKEIYNAGSLELAEEALERFSEKWDKKYPVVSRRWLDNWENLITIFKYPPEIRKVIYTTNAIESLNMVIRKGIRGRRIFPGDASALKIVWMSISQAAKKWTMPVRDWKSALSHFLLMFQNRLSATSL